MKITTLLIPGIALLALAGCNRSSQTASTADQPPPSVTAQTNLDKAQAEMRQAADKAGDAMERAADNTREAAERVADNTRDAAQRAADNTRDAANKAADNTREAVADANAAINARLQEWNLGADAIRADFEKGGRVVRNKLTATSNAVAKTVADPVVVAAINAKYLKDAQLSSRKIDVDAEKGIVVLKGSVSNQANIGRAMVLALDTDGVNQVISELTVVP